MTLPTRSTYDPDRAPDPQRLAWALHDAWAASDWVTFRSLLRPEVVFESPSLGRLEGLDAVVALFSAGRRLPGLTAIDHRRTVADDGVVVRASDASIAHVRGIAIVDILSVREGRVAHWLSITEPWPIHP